MIDRDAVQALVVIVSEALSGGEVVQELGLDPDVAGEKGLRLLFVLRDDTVSYNVVFTYFYNLIFNIIENLKTT